MTKEGESPLDLPEMTGSGIVFIDNGVWIRNNPSLTAFSRVVPTHYTK